MKEIEKNKLSGDPLSHQRASGWTQDVRPVDFSTGEVVIRFDRISKQYRFGSINHGTMADDLQSWWAKLRGREDPNLSIGQSAHLVPHNAPNSDYNENRFWALQDISFDVHRGDILGIIGRNGAGKSTLLKILSRVTTPTQGEINVVGRVASLLEVGTGFHRELTGRENVFLNGAILGMKKHEIHRKFDEIVAFAEIDKFIDTPVKRYSSGMYVRLAFAVAAHLDPDILVIDEVLAVGDTVFQKKCIDKISEVKSQGRTVLFVSHNLSLVNATCSMGAVLRDGKLVFLGATRDAIDRYVDEGSVEGKTIDLGSLQRDDGLQDLVFDKLTFVNYPLRFNDNINLKLSLKSKLPGEEFREMDFGLAICDKDRKRLIHISNRFLDVQINHETDTSDYFFEIESILKPGVYYLTLFLRSREVIQDWLVEAVRFTIEDGNPYDYFDTTQISGAILPKFKIYKK